MTDYRGDSPYYYHTKHRAEYPKGYHGKPQKNRGEKPKGNNGNHYGNDKGNKGKTKEIITPKNSQTRTTITVMANTIDKQD